MLVDFFFELRRVGVPVTLREHLMLMDALSAGAAGMRVVDFYHLARSALVKDERWFDRYDRAFATWFAGMERLEDPFQEIPPEWLKRLGELELSEEERAKIQAMGGWDELLDTLRKRLAEQDERHEGGSRWIGTRGTSPFGAYGYNPMGVRIGQDGSRHRRAVKVWDRREFRDLDDQVELGTRNMKVALRRLRQLARAGFEEELDLPGTIRATARNAGWLDLVMERKRENRIKVLLLLDNGGSMDDHVGLVEQLFSAAKSELDHLEHYYFHNCLYERVWKDNARRWQETTPTEELFRTYGPDWRVIFVGDASMSPYEITEPGGSVEHFNEESGEVWMRRALATWERTIWINPVPEAYWRGTYSIGQIRALVGGRMLPLTLDGLERGTKLLLT